MSAPAATWAMVVAEHRRLARGRARPPATPLYATPYIDMHFGTWASLCWR